eukprot:993009-Prorocentrum_minimum.AAC.3
MNALRANLSLPEFEAPKTHLKHPKPKKEENRSLYISAARARAALPKPHLGKDRSDFVEAAVLLVDTEVRQRHLAPGLRHLAEVPAGGAHDGGKLHQLRRHRREVRLRQFPGVTTDEAEKGPRPLQQLESTSAKVG